MSTQFDPSEPLKNSRHEKFALLVASGKEGQEAYMKVYKAKPEVARVNAARMLAIATDRFYRGRIAARVAWLKRQTATKHTLTMAERREFLARTVKVNLFNFDEDRDGDLAEEILYDDKGKKRIKIASKRGCIMDDARLAGELIEKQDLTSNGEALPTVMPTITLNVPKHFVKRRGQG